MLSELVPIPIENRIPNVNVSTEYEFPISLAVGLSNEMSANPVSSLAKISQIYRSFSYFFPFTNLFHKLNTLST